MSTPFREVAIGDHKCAMFGDQDKSEHSTTSVIWPYPTAFIRRTKLPWSKRLFLLALVLTFGLFFGQSIIYNTALKFRSIANIGSPVGAAQCTYDTSIEQPVSLLAASPWTDDPIKASLLDRAGWKANCSSQADEGLHKCDNAILPTKGSDNADWQSKSSTSGHYIEIDLGKTQIVHSLAVTASNSALGSTVRRHRVEIAVVKDTYQLVAYGMWALVGGKINYATFEPQEARYVRLSVIDTIQKKQFVAIRDLNIYTGNIPPKVPRGGKWSLTLDFPLVPVTAFVNPISKQVITLSADGKESFGNEGQDPVLQARTQSATWDARNSVIEESVVQKGFHSIFCPGTSMDQKGQVMVSGGITKDTYSIYNSVDNVWLPPGKIAKTRGYQGQTFLPNGSTFQIGGTWSGGRNDKDGEIFDPISKKWSMLPNIKAEQIKMAESRLTNDCDPKGDSECIKTEWQQHHPWLFAWQNDTIFHAGPSKNMNWFYYKEPNGKSTPAGVRADDGDAVCGIASMYDAANGVILMAGGAPNYHYWREAKTRRDPTAAHRLESSQNAFEIRLGDVEIGKEVKPKKLPPMKHQRIFANSVIFPNGETMVIGGQRQGEPFVDDTWEPEPEIYSPANNSWRVATGHSTPRVYHSWALLLPDATVICGGTGLGGDGSSTNHFDAQIYEPGYLFKNDDKTLADRPEISAIDKDGYKVGDTIKITTTMEIDDASLIRYSAVTHALNNDLRRIKLSPVSSGNTAEKKYTLQIPKEPGITLPGYWMLFILHQGVPSHARTFAITLP